MRGTDKWINKKIDSKIYEDHTKKFLAKNPNGKVFVATDDPNYLKNVQTLGQEHIVVNSKFLVSEVVLQNKNVRCYTEFLMSRCVSFVKP